KTLRQFKNTHRGCKRSLVDTEFSVAPDVLGSTHRSLSASPRLRVSASLLKAFASREARRLQIFLSFPCARGRRSPCCPWGGRGPRPRRRRPGSPPRRNGGRRARLPRRTAGSARRRRRPGPAGAPLR